MSLVVFLRIGTLFSFLWSRDTIFSQLTAKMALSFSLVLTCVVLLFRAGSASELKLVSLQSKNIVFPCSSASTPMWMMQSRNDKNMRGIAVGDRKQPTFKDGRFVKFIQMSDDLVGIYFVDRTLFHT